MQLNPIAYCNNRPFSLFVAFLAITCLLYFPAFNIGFLSDDYGFLWQAESKGWSAINENFNDPFFLPLSHVIALTIYKIVGANAFVFHSLQLFIHAFAGFQLFLFLKDIWKGEKNSVAILTALFFLIFPYQSEAVIWLAAKSYGYSLILGVFCLRVMIKYLESKKWNHFLLSALLLLGTLLTKEMGFTIPIIGLFIAIYLKQGKAFMPIGILFSILAIGVLILRKIILGEFIGGYGADYHMNFSLSIIGWHLIAYLIKFFSFVRYLSFSNWTLIAFVLLFILTHYKGVIAFFKSNVLWKNALILFFIFIVLLAPVLTLEISSLGSIESDRYGYWASIPICLVFAWSIIQFSRKWKVILSISWVVFFGSISIYNATQWKHADMLSKNYLAALDKIPEDKFILINVPDNYKGVYVLRNGIKEHFLLSKKQKEFSVLEYHSFFRLDGGVRIEGISIIPEGSIFYYMGTNYTLRDTSLLEAYDAIYYFNKGQMMNLSFNNP